MLAVGDEATDVAEGVAVVGFEEVGSVGLLLVAYLMLVEEGAYVLLAHEQQVLRNAKRIVVVQRVLVLIVDAGEGNRGAGYAVVLVSVVDVVDWQRQLGADAGWRLEHRVLFVAHEGGEVTALELRALYDFRRGGEAAECRQDGVGVGFVLVSEVEIDGAYLEVEHSAGAADGTEQEARADVADEGVGVAEVFGVAVVRLHDVLPVLSRQNDAHVVQVAAFGPLCIAQGIVSRCENLRRDGALLGVGELPEVGVGEQAGRFLQQLVLAHAEGPHLYLHRVVLVAESAFDVEPNLDGVAEEAVVVAYDVSLGGEGVVLEGMELCGEGGSDGLICLGVNDFAKVACSAVGGHYGVEDVVGEDIKGCRRSSGGILLWVHAQRACVLGATAEGSYNQC